MSARRALGLVVLALAAGLACRCAGTTRPSARTLRAQIAALEKERDQLRQRLDQQMSHDTRLASMPDAPVRISVPTVLIRSFLEALAAGFADDVRLELQDVKAEKKGELKKLVTLGHYDLQVTIEDVAGTLHAGRPELQFSGNQVGLTLPIALDSGEGNATLHLRWDGTGVSDALCGDMEIRQAVSGRVRPQRYLLRGSLVLSATSQQVLASPRFPLTKVRLEIEPSPASWAAVQRILDQKSGVCGFVLDKLDVGGLLRGVLDKGVKVRLPLEKIPSFAVPVTVGSTIDVQGKPVALGVQLAGLVIAEQSLSFGVSVTLQRADGAAPVNGRTTRSPS